MISLFFAHPRKITKIENFLFFGIFSSQLAKPKVCSQLSVTHPYHHLSCKATIRSKLFVAQKYFYQRKGS